MPLRRLMLWTSAVHCTNHSWSLQSSCGQVQSRLFAFVLWATCITLVVLHLHLWGLLCTGQRLLDALAECKLAWATISYIETQRHSFKELDKIWSNMPFASWEVVREILAILSEFSFMWVPPHVVQLLESVFGSWGTSLLNELGFNVIRQRLKESRNMRFNPTTTWMSLAKSNVMDGFGRRSFSLLDVCLVVGSCCDPSIIAVCGDIGGQCLELFDQSLQAWSSSRCCRLTGLAYINTWFTCRRTIHTTRASQKHHFTEHNEFFFRAQQTCHPCSLVIGSDYLPFQEHPVVWAVLAEPLCTPWRCLVQWDGLRSCSWVIPFFPA